MATFRNGLDTWLKQECATYRWNNLLPIPEKE